MYLKNKILGRVVLGITLTALTIAIFSFLPPAFGTIFVSIWIAMATREFLLLLRRAEIILNQWFLITLNLLTVILAHYRLLPTLIILPMSIVFITTPIHSVLLPRIPVYGIFTVTYLGFLPAHLIMLQQLVIQNSYSTYLTIFPLVLTWLSDTAAYTVGRTVGRHKLAPLLSPRKTVEGALAGIISAGIFAGIVLPTMVPFKNQPRPLLVLTGVALSILGQIGDIFESLFKRAVDIKDSGTTLGEHGGFLDRIDSLLFAIPAFYYITLLTGR